MDSERAQELFLLHLMRSTPDLCFRYPFTEIAFC